MAKVSGLHYKHMRIVKDISSIVSEQSFLLINDARGIIYNHHMFIIQATGAYIRMGKVIEGGSKLIRLVCKFALDTRLSLFGLIVSDSK